MFLCSRGQEESAGTGPAAFQGDSACEALAKELQYITRMAQIASGRVLFMCIDVFRAKSALSKPSQSFPSISRHDLFLRTKTLWYPLKICDTLFLPSCCLQLLLSA